MVDLSDLRGEEFLTSGGVVMMAPRRRFELVYAPEMKKHLRVIECKYYGLIRREIVAQLQFPPLGACFLQWLLIHRPLAAG